VVGDPGGDGEEREMSKATTTLTTSATRPATPAAAPVDELVPGPAAEEDAVPRPASRRWRRVLWVLI